MTRSLRTFDQQSRGAVLMQALIRIPKLDSQTLFSVLLGYYIAIQFFLPSTGIVPRFSTTYFALVLPLLFFVLANFKYLLSGYSVVSRWLLGFAAIVSVVSLVRLDFATVQHVLLFTLPILIILNSGARVNLRLLNGLFLGSFAFCVLLKLGVIFSIIETPYVLSGGEQTEFNRGFLPGIGSDIGDLPVRVSLFPLAPESAFFAVLVLLINLFLGARPWNLIFIALGAAFTLLSGVRAAIAILIVVFTLFALTRFRFSYRSVFYGLFFTVTIMLFVTILTTDVLFYIARRFDSEVINLFFYRNPQGLQSVDHLRETIYRGTVWQYHLKLFLENPFLGYGTFTAADLFRGSPFDARAFCSSCSFLTEWAARVGLLILPFIIFIGVLVVTAIRNRDPYMLGILLTLIIVALTWGSLLVPYNPIFLLLFGAIGTSQRFTRLHRPTNPCP